MPVENPTYIDGLEPDWPLGSDPESDGDDHLRLIKKAVQNTFPNFNSAVTITSDELNTLHGLTFTEADASVGLPDYWWVTTPDHSKSASLSVLTPTLQQLTKSNALVPTWANIQNLIYPVGSVVIYADNVNPNTRLGFGTWVAMTGVIAGVGTATGDDASTVTISAGSGHGKGFINSINITPIPYTPTGKLVMTPVPDHNHIYYSNGTGYSAPYIDANQHGAVSNVGGTSTSSAGGHTPAGSFTGDATNIGTGTTAFVPVYTGVYVWKRTA